VAGRVPEGLTRSVRGPLHPEIASRREYPFTVLARRLRELAPAGRRVIAFSAGDPREETPAFIRDALKQAVPAMSGYPSVAGRPELRAACAGWVQRHFGVTLDPDTQILPANGSKEAVFLFPLAVFDRNDARDTIVIPSPAYPVYEASARIVGARSYLVPLDSRNGWRFDPGVVPEEVWARTAIVWLNTPHNPTGAVLPLDTIERVLKLARRHGFWVASDEAYGEVFFGERPPSALQCGTENLIVFQTLSKRSAMTGYRSGFMAGDADLLDALRRFRPSVGVATPEFVQEAAVAAWNDDAHTEDQRGRYAAKRRLFTDYFAKRGWTIEASEATFYLWLKAPGGDDVAFVERLMRLGLVALPGSYLGEAGSGFVRFALVPTVEDCREAIVRLEELGEDA
jgi:LL-diaminopimelate aminotransferase